MIYVSDINRFVFCDELATTITAVIHALNPMLIRWSGSGERPVDWTPAATNQAGSLRLSHGSEIIAAVKPVRKSWCSRTPPCTPCSTSALLKFGALNSWATTSPSKGRTLRSSSLWNVCYWMGVDKFYAYDGRVQTLPCDLRRACVWGHQPGASALRSLPVRTKASTKSGGSTARPDSMTIDRYVVFSYLEKIWHYGTMARTAWLDSGTLGLPNRSAPTTTTSCMHENGVDDNVTGTPCDQCLHRVCRV
jgi:hypothetical protein